MVFLAGYISTLLAFVAADMAWLGIMVGRLYRPALGDILAADINLPAAIAFYLIFPIGLVIFAEIPAVRSETLGNAALYGALFGFFTYATYDLSNLATVRGWPTQLTLIDMGWGCVLGGFAATIGYLAASRFH